MKLGHHLNQYINIYLYRGECCKTSFIYCFIVTAKNLIWRFFFNFLFMVISREIFICSAVNLHHYLEHYEARKNEESTWSKNWDTASQKFHFCSFLGAILQFYQYSHWRFMYEDDVRPTWFFPGNIYS